MKKHVGFTFTNERWPWSLFIAFIGGIFTDLFMIYADVRCVSGTDQLQQDPDGIPVMVGVGAIILAMFYLPAWATLKSKGWFHWPVICASFAGMLVSQQLVGTMLGWHQFGFLLGIQMICPIMLWCFAAEIAEEPHRSANPSPAT